MLEAQATQVAEALGGDTWQSGGGIWLVLFKRSDGRIVALSDEMVCEYRSEDDLERSEPSLSIALH